MLKLIRATTADITTIYELAFRIWNHHYVPIVGQQQVDYMLGKIYSKEGLTEQMTEKRHQFYLIVFEAQTIGFVSVSGEADMFIHKFYIDQSLQGRGYGEEVFELVLALYPQANTYTLTVNRSNYKSINFYFKIGFKIDHIDDFDIGEGFFMNDFIMQWAKVSSFLKDNV